MKKLALHIFLFCTVAAYSQSANYFQAGVLRNHFQKDSRWQNAWWPGFSLTAKGISINFYSGRNTAVNVAELPFEKDYKAGGSFFDIGFTKDLLKLDPLRRVAKRPIIYPTIGGGLGSYGLDDTTGFQINIKPGIKFTPIPGISFVAQLHAGYSSGNRAIKGFYIAPAFGIQFSTNLEQVLGDTWTKTKHSSGGWREYEYTKSDGSRWKHTYYQPEGDYVNSYVTESRNWLNFTLKGFVGTGRTDRGDTYGGGPALSLRWGMFAFDLEYLLGKVGYTETALNREKRYQTSWNMKRFGFGMGIDIFGITRPFKRPSFVRLIVGAKVGVRSLESEMGEYAAILSDLGTPPAVSISSKPYWAGMLQFEFGTLGINFEFINYNTTNYNYKSGLCLGFSYMIPLAIAE